MPTIRGNSIRQSLDWRSSRVYNKGDEVKVDGQSYEALYYTVGENPSIAGNQNPTSTNGRPWKPLGPTVEFTQEQFNNAPQINSIALYEAGKLAVYKGIPYVAQTKVKGVMPYDKTHGRFIPTGLAPKSA